MNPATLTQNAQQTDSFAEALAATGQRAVLEPKFDGWRLLVHVGEISVRTVTGGKSRVRTFTRRGNELTGLTVPIEQALAKAKVPGGTWLDGEIAVVSQDGEGRMVWGDVSHACSTAEQGAGASFFAFDLLFHAGDDLRSLPLTERRQRLEDVLAGVDRATVTVVPQFPASEEAHEALLAHGFEGSVLKRLDSSYASGKRGQGWFKVKPQTTEEAIVLRFEDGKAEGTLVFGQLREGELVEVGRCRSPLAPGDREAHLGRLFEFAHHGIQSKGGYRHPTFKRWRDPRTLEPCQAA